jgi:hypothetical protein
MGDALLSIRCPIGGSRIDDKKDERTDTTARNDPFRKATCPNGQSPLTPSIHATDRTGRQWTGFRRCRLFIMKDDTPLKPAERAILQVISLGITSRPVGREVKD